MRSGKVQASQITASSESDPNHGPNNARCPLQHEMEEKELGLQKPMILTNGYRLISNDKLFWLVSVLREEKIAVHSGSKPTRCITASTG